MEYPSNVILLLLQLLLQRQQTLAHHDKSLDLTQLLREPIIDKEVLAQFQNHKLVKMYSPELCNLHLRALRGLVTDLFTYGIPGAEGLDAQETNVITLANYYYNKRLAELTLTQLPELRQEIKSLLPE
ncbi:hypothetical protein HG536_0E01610 [Torulaspora globosa]|uniref:SWR1-complex protein 7 n=1 Tax=Torulaspora globosa TaxID=48254 RepID=A0A7G3ZIB4_9SACH|nr:uncharacterized protein HG536_0E01610 [Torulaspora globosa]QLL33250.1 hypothetical protein HG536_0E01610 [Torulaspora globosa]